MNVVKLCRCRPRIVCGGAETDEKYFQGCPHEIIHICSFQKFGGPTLRAYGGQAPSSGFTRRKGLNLRNNISGALIDPSVHHFIPHRIERSAYQIAPDFLLLEAPRAGDVSRQSDIDYSRALEVERRYIQEAISLSAIPQCHGPHAPKLLFPPLLPGMIPRRRHKATTRRTKGQAFLQIIWPKRPGMGPKSPGLRPLVFGPRALRPGRMQVDQPFTADLARVPEVRKVERR